MTIRFAVPRNFSFRRTVYSHGWCALPPFKVSEDDFTLTLAIPRALGAPYSIQVRQPDPAHLTITTTNGATSSRTKRETTISAVRSCLRLDEDFSEFYAESRKHPHHRWISKKGAGRLLRAPTVFEDVVKMICTTNCSWALTEIIVHNLCGKLGAVMEDGGNAFPSPDAIAGSSEQFLRKHIRAGYRAPYLLELSRHIVKGRLNVESWGSSSLPTSELFEEVRAVKGIGPYAAGNILKLLGRYDYLGIDSWCRKLFSEIYRNGRKVSDKAIEKHYASSGRWRGLFFWLDVTKQWYDKKSPFYADRIP